MQYQKISILPPQKGLEFPGGGGGGFSKTKKLKKCVKFNWNFQMGRRGILEKSLPWGRYGYFLELRMGY